MGRHSAPPPLAPFPPAPPVTLGPRHARPQDSGRRRVTVPGPLASSALQRSGQHRAGAPGRPSSSAQPARLSSPSSALASSSTRSASARHRAVQPTLPNRAPLWRRSPAVPAAVAVLAVWSGANAPHLLPAGHAGPVPRAAAGELALGGSGALGGSDALGGSGASDTDRGVDSTTVSAAAQLAAADRRVSRASRALTSPRAAEPAPLRSAVLKPAAKPAKHVERWVRPSAGAESSCFCMRWGVMHEGIDLAGPLGSPIVAVGDGVVVEAGPASGFGLWVVIRHANGDYSIYGHMYTYYVTVGEHVRAGQHIADIGANGQSTGPHLHFGVARGSAFGPYLDPVPWLAARGVSVGAYNPDA